MGSVGYRPILNEKRMEVILLIGLPGSGKTWTAHNVYAPKGYMVVDDPKSIHTVREVLSNAKATGAPGVVVADPHLTSPTALSKALEFFQGQGATVTCVWFENDLAAAAKNIQHRADGRQINLRAFAHGYQVPEGVTPTKIWRSPA